MLNKIMQKQLGLSDSQMYGSGAGGFGGGGGGGGGGAPQQTQAAEPKKEEPPKEEVKTSFSLVLTAVPEDAKFKVLKEVRILKPGMKLMESKELVDKLPSTLKDDVPKEEADQWLAKFKELGATLELK